MWKKYLKQLSLPESYISITLGFLVVIVAGLLIFNYLSNNKPQPPLSEEKTEEWKVEETNKLPTTHIIGEKETLWSIAEKYYQSGYNWVNLAQANNLKNPNYIQIGQKITIPKAEKIIPPGEKISSAAVEMKNYKVVRGDSLWKIALKEYGDGYAWVKIAQINKLTHPDLIYPDQVLKLPL